MTALPIDLEAFDAAPLAREPFAYAMVPRFVKPEAMAGDQCRLSAGQPSRLLSAADPEIWPGLRPLSWRRSRAPNSPRAVETQAGRRSQRPAHHGDGARRFGGARRPDPYRQPHQADHGADLYEQCLGGEDRAAAAAARTGRSERRDRRSAAR